MGQKITIQSPREKYKLLYEIKGEFKMGVDGYSLIVLDEDGNIFSDYFKDRYAWVGHITKENPPHFFDKNESFLIIKDNHNATYVLDLENKLLSLYKTTIRTFSGEVCNENAIWGNEKMRIHLPEDVLYIQFPFLSLSEFDQVVKRYTEIRKTQIELLRDKGVRKNFILRLLRQYTQAYKTRLEYKKAISFLKTRYSEEEMENIQRTIQETLPGSKKRHER